MDDLTNDCPLTGGGKTTFELIDNYLLILIGHYVNRILTCGGKTGHNSGQCVPCMYHLTQYNVKQHSNCNNNPTSCSSVTFNTFLTIILLAEVKSHECVFRTSLGFPGCGVQKYSVAVNFFAICMQYTVVYKALSVIANVSIQWSAYDF